MLHHLIGLHNRPQVQEFLISFDEAFVLLSPSGKLADPVEKATKRAEVANGPLRVWMERFNGQVASSASGYAVDGSLTIADVWLWCFVRYFRAGHVDYVPPTYIDQFPALVAHFEHISALPKVQQYLAQRK